MKPLIFTNSPQPQSMVEPSAGLPATRHLRSRVVIPITGFKMTGPALRTVPPANIAISASRRTKLWELNATLHCSVIGTCLTTGELRTILRKSSGLADRNATDHELHSTAVAAIGGNDEIAKQIQKTLDQHYKPVIGRFSGAKNLDHLRQYWEEALQNGDVPGAYWALLTHPMTTEELVRRAFGDVHMLSHLVGAANRADIRRLRQLEEEKAALEEKLARQQARLRDGFLSRDTRIRELSAALSTRIEQTNGATGSADRSSEFAVVKSLVADLRKQVDIEIRRRERVEKKLQELATAQAGADAARLDMKRELEALREELEAAEARLPMPSSEDGESSLDDLNLAGLTILYVGGRAHQVTRLKWLVERASGQFVHHDGGLEERRDLLPGLVSRADIAACPVDCVSHTAALTVKRLCRQSGKPFMPLRSSGCASFLRAIKAENLPVSVPAAV
jgi:Uncharacterized protein conserved in bacteria (DUF2325)